MKNKINNINKLSLAFCLCYFYIPIFSPDLFKTIATHIVAIIISLVLLWVRFHFLKKAK